MLVPKIAYLSFFEFSLIFFQKSTYTTNMLKSDQEIENQHQIKLHLPTYTVC